MGFRSLSEIEELVNRIEIGCDKPDCVPCRRRQAEREARDNSEIKLFNKYEIYVFGYNRKLCVQGIGITGGSEISSTKSKPGTKSKREANEGTI